MTHKAPVSQPLEPRMWCSVIRGLLLPLTEHNIDPTPLLAECGITENDLRKPHGEVPLKKYLQFFSATAKAANDPLLALRLARTASPETLGALGFLFLSSRTLFEAMSHFCHYMNLLQDTTHVQFYQRPQEFVFTYQLYHVSDSVCRQDVEFSLAHTCRMMRIYAGADIEISAVNFRHSRSAPAREYQNLLRAPVYFEQDTNSIVIPASLAKARSKVIDSSLSGILQDFLDEKLEKHCHVQTFTDRVSRALIDGNLTPPITAANISRHLGVSEPTLYRRLKAEGESFTNIVDKINFEIARNYLAESSLSITQIAYVIGFSEAASFTRAFSRWSNGQTPSRYRQKMLS
jgi:AraC-like DNA-binding protein